MASLRLMSFNLRRDIPADLDDRWRHRRDAAARLIARAAPHVLGTQEALAHQLADLDERLPHLRRVGTDRQGDGSDEHNAIYYDPRRLLLVAWGDLWLSDTPELPASRSWGNRLPRIATWARLTDQESGRSFTIVNTHLDHESQDARDRAAEMLDARFPDAILLGDFNDAPGSAPHRVLTRTRRDVLEPHRRGTFHRFTGAPRGDRIDWILAPHGERVVGSSVLDDRVDGRWPSDHFPVVAEILSEKVAAIAVEPTN